MEDSEVSICNLTILLPLLSKVIIKSKTGTIGSIFMATLRAATLKDTVEIQEVESKDQELGRLPKSPDW
eukprot:3366414-Ditylum_brightwellii.AAC.1